MMSVPITPKLDQEVLFFSTGCPKGNFPLLFENKERKLFHWQFWFYYFRIPNSSAFEFLILRMLQSRIGYGFKELQLLEVKICAKVKTRCPLFCPNNSISQIHKTKISSFTGLIWSLPDFLAISMRQLGSLLRHIRQVYRLSQRGVPCVNENNSRNICSSAKKYIFLETWDVC